jgi:hypothetical protein
MRRALALPTVLAFASVAAFLVPAMASTAGAQRVQFIETQLRIGNGPPAFHGKVQADKAVCVPHRKILLYREEQGGPSALLGSDHSDRKGRWEIKVSHLASGAYYAKAKPVYPTPHVLCQEDQSRVVTVD